MDIFFLILYAAYPEIAVLGYFGFLGDRGKRASEHFGAIVLLVFGVAIVLTLLMLLYEPLRHV